jgi:aminodeoxychorismate synthase component I/2-amino-4-hydroxy-6-hydroxymethyldihydropteridine diphosphokinase
LKKTKKYTYQKNFLPDVFVMGKSTKLHYKLISQWQDPEILFEALFANEKHSFWLDSNLTDSDNRFSYMGSSDEIYSYCIKDSKQDIFSFLDSRLKETKIETELPFDFIGGYVGYFGYELKSLTDGKAAHTSPYPDGLWFLINKFLAFDHLEQKIYLVCLEENKSEADLWFESIFFKLKNFAGFRHPGEQTRLQNPDSGPYKRTIHFVGSQARMKFKLSRSKQQYLKDIKKCKELLEKGESYQICLTNQITTEAAVDPLLLYKMLRINNPAPYSAFLKTDDQVILSSSPEQFLKINNDRTVQTKPIKGTIKRGHTLAEDKKLKNQLKQSKKDWSENAMIVDLLRNDLGKVCAFGSVKVTKSMEIESYRSVHQLVSTVVGQLREDVTVIDCVKACFPGGSMTGAPKIRTMEILDQLERQARGIYSGALGFLSFNGTAELSIVIRTIVAEKNRLSIGAGGAILIDSDPQKEYDEMLLKAKALLETIEKVYTTPMQTVFLALGSNVGNKKKNIKQAIDYLAKHVTDIEIAKLYETAPMYFENQEKFLNTVAKGKTLLSPLELLAFVKNAERELGRQVRFRNGPREIDIDILFYNQLVYESDDLIIPHPRISEREFVLEPFMDLDPNFIHPIFNKTIKELHTALQKKK